VIYGQKVISAAEMQRIEKLASVNDRGKFMDNAAYGIALITKEFIQELKLPRKILLLTGKGNNAGDAYTTGTLLLKQGFSVLAVAAFPLKECSSLCRERHDRFIKSGGKVVPLSQATTQGYGVILDGLVGTGFKGKASGLLAKAIVWANQSDLPILAIDIPSGLNATTGQVETVAIDAVGTIYLGLPKIGFFLKKGGTMLENSPVLISDWVKNPSCKLEKKPFFLIQLPFIFHSSSEHDINMRQAMSLELRDRPKCLALPH
jgi:NAD(P)H-hydrate epimerase